MNSYPGPGKFSFLLALAMLPIFLGLGFLFLATDMWIENYPKPTRYYIGLVLVGWAVFRGITIWLKYKRSRNEDEDYHT